MGSCVHPSGPKWVQLAGTHLGREGQIVGVPICAQRRLVAGTSASRRYVSSGQRPAKLAPQLPTQIVVHFSATNGRQRLAFPGTGQPIWRRRRRANCAIAPTAVAHLGRLRPYGPGCLGSGWSARSSQMGPVGDQFLLGNLPSAAGKLCTKVSTMSPKAGPILRDSDRSLEH